MRYAGDCSIGGIPHTFGVPADDYGNMTVQKLRKVVQSGTKPKRKFGPNARGAHAICDCVRIFIFT